MSSYVIRLYLAVLSIPAYFNIYSWACTCQLGLNLHFLGISYRKDIGGKNGRAVVFFLKGELHSSFKTVQALRFYATFM